MLPAAEEKVGVPAGAEGEEVDVLTAADEEDDDDGVLSDVEVEEEVGVCGVAMDEDDVLLVDCNEDSVVDDEVTGGVDCELNGYGGTEGTVRSLGKAGTLGT